MLMHFVASLVDYFFLSTYWNKKYNHSLYKELPVYLYLRNNFLLMWKRKHRKILNLKKKKNACFKEFWQIKISPRKQM